MNGLRRYLELVEHGRALESSGRSADVHRHLVELVGYAHECDELAVEGAWRLDSRVSRELEARYQASPPGGWPALAGLACGCGVLRARRDAFEPAADVGELAGREPAAVRRQLVEAFTRRLVPPSAAAGLFMVMGIHPAWGLRVAHATQKRRRPQPGGASPDAVEPGWRDESLFPAATAEIVQQAVFSAVATTVAVLRKLSATQCYPVDALAGVVEAACQFARRCAQDHLEHGPRPGLSPFVGDAGDGLSTRHYRTLDFATVDLLDGVLVPAGVARRFDDGSFCVVDDGLDGVRVAELDVEAQQMKLCWMLAGEPDSQVA